MNRFRLFPPPKLYNKFYGKERRIGVNGGRGERAYNGWTCSFVKERRKRERGSESRSHVITNAAGIHDPTSPRPSTSTPPRPSATTTSRRSFSTRPPRLSLVRTGGPRSRPYNVHVLNGGPTTKQEERKTFSNSASTRSSFTEPAPHNRTQPAFG